MIIALQIISGLVAASILFLLAAGLSLIFGVCRVLNLAHGTLFMFAIYLAYSATGILSESGFGFWFALIVVPIALAFVGVVIEVTLFRRLYAADILVQTLPTLALIYIIQDVVRFTWGLTPKVISKPELLSHPVEFFGIFFPAYYGFVAAVGLLVGGLIWFFIHRTDWGLLIRAISQDRDMAASLGVNSRTLFTSVFAVSLALVGLAGVLSAPIVGANNTLDVDATVDAFAVVVIGGVGSIFGSAVAAILIGLVKSFGILVVPRFAMAIVFALMAIILIVRPTGLMGRKK